MTRFFRYPHTPHLTWLGTGSPRGDKVLSRAEVEGLLADELIVEEKLDGANLGISINDQGSLSFQNRGQYLTEPFIGQFSRLSGWATQHEKALHQILTPGLILFGEWMAARHSITYERLPDWFVAFDVYDSSAGGFWAANRRDAFAGEIGIAVVPCLFRGKARLVELEAMLTHRLSSYGSVPLEGLVLRHDGAVLNEWRAKLVRPDFVQAIDEHWRRRGLEWNRVQ